MADGLRRRLLRWYGAHRRDLPWRRDTDTYRVWVSETMLQQTTVAAVVPYYERWMLRFHSVDALANAKEEQVLSLWQGLGYYRRARNLLAAAKTVAQEGWPATVDEWKKLPGVGDYTAAAVCSICFGARAPSVDGNVERVYARVTADSSTSLRKPANDWAVALVDCRRPGDVNQALMELGATVCRPKNPDCPRCPINASCTAFARGIQNDLPMRTTPKGTKSVHQTIYVPYKDGRFGVRRTRKGDWWQGMWEFVRSDSQRGVPRGLSAKRAKRLGEINYTVTHHRIEAKALLVHCNGEDIGLSWKTAKQLQHLPLPSPQRKALVLAQRYLQGKGAKPTGTAKEPSSAKK